MVRRWQWALGALLVGVASACGMAGAPTDEDLGEEGEASLDVDGGETEGDAGASGEGEGDAEAPGADLNAACYRRVGHFGWHCAGPIPGMSCIQILEPSDPHTWTDNYFCADIVIGMAWSYAGPIYGMECTQIHEHSDPHTWADNYLCVTPGSGYHFAWSSAGPLTGLACIQWIEPSDPHTWADNYLCFSE